MKHLRFTPPRILISLTGETVLLAQVFFPEGEKKESILSGRGSPEGVRAC